MRLRSSWPLRLAAALSFCGSLVLASAAGAQQRPTPQQAQELLRQRPELIQQLQQRLRSSGLSNEQIRSRLRAEGYPESLLDSYLPGGQRSESDTASSYTVLSAIEALGVVDSSDVRDLRRTAGLDPRDDRYGGRYDDECDDRYMDRLDDRSRDDRFDRDTLRGDRSGDDTLGLGIDSLRPRRNSARDTTRLRTRRCISRADSIAAARDSGFTIFGLDLFRGRTTQFDPNLAGPVDANYRLGPGDRLVLLLTGDVEAGHTLDVTREGFVVVPQVGQLYVANLTLGQLEDLLFTRLRRVYSGIGRGPNARTRFSVSVARLRSNQIFVVGDVERPGSYRVSSAGTALTALYAAGGPTRVGSLRSILIVRGGRTVDTLDVYDYLLRGDASHDVRLESGDRVFVPPHGPQARIYGHVLRPATYELKPGETLTQLITAAGGFEATAALQRVQIERVLPAGQRASAGGARVVVTVPLTDGGATVPAAPIAAGDVVRVFEVAARVRNRVQVAGNVWTPGAIGFNPGMRLSDALRSAGGLKPDSYLGEVLVTRLRPDSSRVQLRAALRDTTGVALDDIALQDDDEVRVFSVSEFRPRRYVAITGAVRKSGRVPYREGMTVRDLVLLAGGLQESALLNEAEIARLPEDRRDGVTARPFRVPLDSSYLFERSADGRYVGPPGVPAPSGPSAEVVLQPYDNVLIFRQPDFALQRTVFLGGEVRLPGTYTLRTKSERLTDVIARAGGLTSEANPDGVEFYRSRGKLGRVGIDVPATLRNARNRDNMILVDGDSIIVPAFTSVITVAGAVNQPTALTYVPGQDINYYIRAAGGGDRRADLGRAYVVQPNGRLQSVVRRRFLPDGLPEPRPGAKIVVPERSPNDSQNLGQAVALIAQVGGTLAAVIAAIITLRRN